MTEVKVCGMMRPQDVKAASSADYLGFIVSSSSRRCLSVSKARDLMSLAAPRKVMVTTSSDIDAIAKLANELRPDVVQVHVELPPEKMERLRSIIDPELWLLLPVGRSIAMLTVTELRKHADKVVLDTPSEMGGGSGRAHDWDVSSAIVGVLRPTKSVLAGGLGPSNVSQAIGKVGPDVVDVSSGVEQDGVKSPKLISDFIERARETDVGSIPS